MAKNKTPPTSVFGRSLKIAGMASRLAAKEIAQRVSGAAQKKYEELTPAQIKRRVDQARIIAENLGHLKGAAMKAGQLLSLDASNFLPPEAVEILSKLQAQATQMPYHLVEKRLRDELGEKNLKDLKELSEKALASASIGQVHKARLHGKPVAIKVQYPGVDESIDSDLKMLQKLIEQYLTFSGKPIDTEAVFNELKRVLKNEVNYEYELKWLTYFHDHFKHSHKYSVPKPYGDYSSRHVLVMGFEEGLTLTEWLKTKPSLEQRRELARRLLDLFMIEFVDLGVVQTDPNFANFLIREDPHAPGGFKMVLLDFGATLAYPEEFKAQYRSLLQAIGEGQDDKLIEHAISYGFLSPKETEETKRYFVEMVRTAIRPFDPDLQPYQFADDKYEEDSREIIIKFTYALQYSSPPRDVIFLHRKMGGVFHLLKRMEVDLDVLKYWEKMTSNPVSSQ